MRLNIKNEREKKLFHDEGDEEEGQTLRDRNWKLGGKTWRITPSYSWRWTLNDRFPSMPIYYWCAVFRADATKMGKPTLPWLDLYLESHYR